MANAPFNITCSEGGEGGGGTRELEKWKGKRDMSILKGWEKREIGENYATMLTIEKRLKGGSQEKGEPEPRVREAGDLDPVKRARNKNLNSSLSFRQAALTFC